MPLNRRGSVSTRLRVWLYRRSTPRNVRRSASETSAPGVSAIGGHTAADRQGAKRRSSRAAVSRDLRETRECTHKGWALGGDRFREQVEVLGQRRAASKGVAGLERKIIASDPVDVEYRTQLDALYP
jgi:cation diffusion facilitator CzcD-associated flavoprotein CzcO